MAAVALGVIRTDIPTRLDRLLMAAGGVAEILWGVKAERAQLEDIAKPLTADEAETPEAPQAPPGPWALSNRPPEQQAHDR